MLGLLKAVPWQVWVVSALALGFLAWLKEHDRTVKLRAELELHQPAIDSVGAIVDSLETKLEEDSVRWDAQLTDAARRFEELQQRDEASEAEHIYAATTVDSLVAQVRKHSPPELAQVVAALDTAILAEREAAAERLAIRASQVSVLQGQVSTLQEMVGRERELRIGLQQENALLTAQLERAYDALKPGFFEKVSNHPLTKLGLVGLGYGLGKL